MISRRRALQSVGVLFAGVGSGCLGQFGSSSERVRWRRQISGTPHLANGVLYVMGRLQLYALSPNDGQSQWTVEWDEEQFDQRLCLQQDLGIDDEHLYVAGCDGLRALRRSDGEQEWFTDASLRSEVAVGSGRVYANSEDLLAVDATTGEIEWRAPTEGERLTRPAVSNETIVHTNRVDGVVTAFDTDGEQRWQYRTEAETRSPTIAGDTVYVATAEAGRVGELLALNQADGSVRWRIDISPTVTRGTRPVVCNDTVLVGCSGPEQGRLLALDASDGTEQWTFTDENSKVYEPVIGEDAVYVGSNDNHVYAFSADGDLQWSYEMKQTVGTVDAGGTLVYASGAALFGLSAD